MNLADRKLVGLFRAFVERVFVPQLSKMDPQCQQEWTKFSAMISNQQINLGEVQLYVDTLPSISPGLNRQNFDRAENKSPLFAKSRKESVSEPNTGGGFNPSRTFGGERARMMFPLKDFDQPQQDRQNYNFSKDFSKDKQESSSGLTTQAVLPTLERLFKLFSQNQVKMQKIGQAPLPNSYEHKTYYN